MAHDVFICHSSRDKAIADAVCHSLESDGIRCWISPRDVVPGTDYASSIVDAIAHSALVVLVFSSHSNGSGHVGREIERAVSHGIPILPFRVEDVDPSPALEYYISVSHWLDAYTKPLEPHLQHLSGTIRMLLDRAAVAPAPVADEPEAAETEPPVPVGVAAPAAATTGPPPTASGPAPTAAEPRYPIHWDDAAVATASPPHIEPAPARSRKPRRAAVAVVAALAIGTAGVALATRGGSRCDPRAGADLSACDLSERDLTEADLSGAILVEADLSDADLSGADLSRADLTDADLSDADLGGADLSDADLRGARLDDTNLRGTNLRRASLTSLDLSATDLRGARLDDTDLAGAVLAGLDLGGASLAGADLSGADLSGVVADEVDFTEATTEATVLDLADLTGSVGMTDEMLQAALGVGIEELAATTAIRGVRFDSVDAIIAAGTGVRDGTPIVGARRYDGSEVFHPAVVVGPAAESGTPDWLADLESGWAPTAIRFSELVVVPRDVTWEVIQICQYNVGGVSADPITRYQAVVTVQVLAASDGSVVAERSFIGSEPRACRDSEPVDLTELRGELPDLAGEAVAWLEGIIHPPPR